MKRCNSQAASIAAAAAAATANAAPQPQLLYQRPPPSSPYRPLSVTDCLPALPPRPAPQAPQSVWPPPPSQPSQAINCSEWPLHNGLSGIIFSPLTSAAYPLGSGTVAGLPHHTVLSPINVTIAPGDSVPLRTELAMLLPIGCFGSFYPVAALTKWGHLAVDSQPLASADGNVTLRIFNFGDHPYCIHRGDTVALLRIERCNHRH